MMKHPIMIGIEDQQVYLEINGKQVGFCSNIELKTDPKYAIADLKIERIIIHPEFSIAKDIEDLFSHCNTTLTQIYMPGTGSTEIF